MWCCSSFHSSQLRWEWSQYNSLSVWYINSLSGRNLISMLSSSHLPQPQDFWEAIGTTHTFPLWNLALGGRKIAVPPAVIQGHKLWQPEPPNKLWKFQPPEELRRTKMVLAEITGAGRSLLGAANILGPDVNQETAHFELNNKVSRDWRTQRWK